MNWASSITGRVAILMLSGLIVVQFASAYFFLIEENITKSAVFEQNVTDRLEAAHMLIENTDPETLETLVPLISDANFSASFIKPEINDDWNTEQLPTMPDHAVWRKETSFLEADELIVELRVVPNTPIYIHAIRPDVSSGWVLHMIAWTTVAGLLLVVFAIWAAAKVTKPFQSFAKAAERFGRGELERPLEETGTAELVKASEAFNKMRSRIIRLINERVQIVEAVAHDLRTAVTRMTLRAEIIEDETLRAKIQKDVREIGDIVETALTFAKDDSTKEPHQNVDLAALLAAIANDAEDVGENVTYEGPISLIKSIKPVSMRRAIGNIVSNATKYAGSASIQLSQTEKSTIIEVSDDGPGIGEELLKSVLEAYVRAEPSRSKDTGGLGLGLAIAQDIILAHGGTLSLANRQPKGLSVTIKLPI